MTDNACSRGIDEFIAIQFTTTDIQYIYALNVIFCSVVVSDKPYLKRSTHMLPIFTKRCCCCRCFFYSCSIWVVSLSSFKFLNFGSLHLTLVYSIVLRFVFWSVVFNFNAICICIPSIVRTESVLCKLVCTRLCRHNFLASFLIGILFEEYFKWLWWLIFCFCCYFSMSFDSKFCTLLLESTWTSMWCKRVYR